MHAKVFVCESFSLNHSPQPLTIFTLTGGRASKKINSELNFLVVNILNKHKSPCCVIFQGRGTQPTLLLPSSHSL